jgi:hypothetical protein
MLKDEDELQDVNEDDEATPAKFEITSYGADYPIDGLVKRLEAGDIFVPTFEPSAQLEEGLIGFQRKFVWKKSQMDRFVESLLLGLPVPGIFLLKAKNGKLLVLDGQQRLMTLLYFYRQEIADKVYRLENVQLPFKGKKYDELESNDRRRLDDSIVHATVLRQNNDDGNQNAVYSIFERLNTGGSPLTPQEIRVALFPGKFLRGVNELNKLDSWRTLYGKRIDDRLKDHEMIIRIFALYEQLIPYSNPLKAYLNDYLELKQDLELDSSSELWILFSEAMSLLLEEVGPNAFRPNKLLNAAVMDALVISVMRRIKQGGEYRRSDLNALYYELMDESSFVEFSNNTTSAEDRVKGRIRIANEIIGKL